MTVVVPEMFLPEYSAEEVYQIVNTMPVSYLDFAHGTHYYHRLFGVLTGGIEGEELNDFVVNQCLREEVWRTLYTVTEYTEKHVGFCLSERFHQETILWPFGSRHVARWPGIVAVGVRPQWTEIEGYGPFPVSPFILRNVNVSTEDGVTSVELSRSVVSNPHDVIIRRSEDYDVYFEKPGSRPVRLPNGNWQVEIDTRRTELDEEQGIVVQHRKYAVLDVDPPPAGSYPEGATLYPVYAGTTQKIPLARPPQTLENGKTRYWFYLYTLVDPSFFNDTVNLMDGEYYKLVQQIEIKAYSEVSVPAVLTKTCKTDDAGCETKTYDVTVHVVDAENGVLEFVVDTTDRIDPTDANYQLTFYYKTSPLALSPRTQKDIPALKRAIIHRTAADLPMSDCGYKVVLGFIAEQQKTYGKTYYTPTGETAVFSRYGDLHGHKVYAELLSNVSVHRSLLI